MRHFTAPSFWVCYRKLPAAVQKLADKNYDLLKADPFHPSLHFKKIGRYRTVRVGLHYRAVGVEHSEGVVWFWVGSHAEYDRLWG